MTEAASKAGFDFNATDKWEKQLVEAGFVDVYMRKAAWPVGPWAKGRKAKILGEMGLHNALVGQCSLHLALLPDLPNLPPSYFSSNHGMFALLTKSRVSYPRAE